MQKYSRTCITSRRTEGLCKYQCVLVNIKRTEKYKAYLEKSETENDSKIQQDASSSKDDGDAKSKEKDQGIK